MGVLSHDDALSYGITGPSGRASGWACDVRKLIPYSGYDKLDFEQVVRRSSGFTSSMTVPLPFRICFTTCGL